MRIGGRETILQWHDLRKLAALPNGGSGGPALPPESSRTVGLRLLDRWVAVPTERAATAPDWDSPRSSHPSTLLPFHPSNLPIFFFQSSACPFTNQGCMTPFSFNRRSLNGNPHPDISLSHHGIGARGTSDSILTYESCPRFDQRAGV
jgi:hypothetical protein